MLKTLLLILAAISFVIVIGGATYEHAAVVPVWTAAVPQSLSMFQGAYALAPANFWIPVHPITMLLLLIAMIANWRTPRRWFVVATILGYAAVLVLTFVYFVPELMALTRTAYAATVDPELTRRANLWEMLSLVRLGFLILMAVVLLFGLTKSSRSENLAALPQ